jgi:hypothetical protein
MFNLNGEVFAINAGLTSSPGTVRSTALWDAAP